MPNIFDAILADDAAMAFCNSDEFAESWTFVPAGGVARTVKVVVNRMPPTAVMDTDGKFAGTKTVFMQNHATRGATSIDKDGDYFNGPDTVGGASRKHRIVEIISQDAGGFHLRLR